MVGVRGGGVAAVLVAAGLLLWACADDPDSAGTGGGGNQQTLPPSQPSTTDDAATTTTIDEQEAAEEALDAELRAAHEQFWETEALLFAAPDPNDPRLAEVATGLTLALVRESLATRQVEGITSAPPPGPSVSSREVMSVDWDGRGDVDPATVTEAVVESCIVDDSVSYGPDGLVIAEDVDHQPGTARWELTFVVEDGTWKVTQSDVFDQVDGVQPCAAA